MTTVWVVMVVANRFPDAGVVCVTHTKERAYRLATDWLAENDADYGRLDMVTPDHYEVIGDVFTVRITKEEVQS